jgi:integrase
MARIRRHRSKWQVLFRDPATQKERSAGVFTRKSDAEKVKREVEYRIAVGRWIDPDRDGSSITLRDWWQDVEPTWLGRGQSTRDRDRSYFGTLIDPYLGDTALSAIDAVALENWVGELNRAGYSPATIAKAAQLIRRVLQEAVNHDLTARNPADRLTGKLPAVETHEPPHLTEADAHRLADAAGDRWRAFVLFGYYAGTRWGETAAVRRSRLNLRRGTVVIDATLNRDLTLGSPKTNRSRRTIHLPGQLQATLQTHVRRFYQPGCEPDLIFTSLGGGPIRYTNWRSRVWVPTTRIAALEGVRYHDLRHAHASLLIDAGIDPVKVSRRLGHSRTSITVDRYSHLLDRDEAAILDVFRSRDADLTRTNTGNVVSFDP